MFVFMKMVLIIQASACAIDNNYRRNVNQPALNPGTNNNAQFRNNMTGGGPQGPQRPQGPQGPGNRPDNRPDRYTSEPTSKGRTTVHRVSLEEDCDYLAFYCMKAYKTGKICGRTLYYNYQDFKNYCMLDYVNCMERYEVWQIVHMGECFKLEALKEYQHYEYHDDFFLDQTYVMLD